MDNKLSELSKPVMYVVRTLDGSVASVKNYKYTAPKGFTSEPLYSQEYVSALLEELEAKDKRNAELHSTIERWATDRAESANQIDELEAKLATPVRLKKVDSSNVPFAGDGFNAAVDYCAKAVRAAGFTVEGDE